MNVKEGYDAWSSRYDENENKTRDLEKTAAELILSPYQFSTVIEIGCGTGKNTAFLCSKARTVLALDFSEKMIDRAKAKIGFPNVVFRVADINEPWLVIAGSTDLVCCSLVLEHIINLDHIYSQAARALKSGGLFYICELHPYKQYGGSKARFQYNESLVVLPCYIHHIYEFMDTAFDNGFRCVGLKEWFDDGSELNPPRLISFVFQKL